MTDHANPIYNNEEAARKHLEAIRWPNGPICPHCGSVSKDHYEIKAHSAPVPTVDPEGHKARHTVARAGLWKCRDCRKQFSVTVGTVFERSKIPLHKWLYASHLFVSSKKGVSAHQIHRTIGVTYKTAWFMMHRIRKAAEPAVPPSNMGQGGKFVEADETFFGKKDKGGYKMHKGGAVVPHKNMVFTLVERGGKARSFHISGPMFQGIKEALQRGVSLEAHLQTDQAKMYNNLGKAFASHGRVNHSINEYVRGTDYTNTVENFFSVFKRGMRGIYQHCKSAHLHRYLAEFDFRYNNRIALGVTDTQRATILLQGIEGKRLTYKSNYEHEAAR
jgi:transposase-like protein